jgi:hypothetical protein|tara:strand:- start:369 stop:848 length:480 start_codon:yes stop_codon:yes gene_type:complete
MKVLITGGNGFLANSLKQYIDGDYYGKDMLDVTDRNCIRNLRTYDVLIHTATGNTSVNDNLPLLFSKAKRIFAFTSKQGTFMNWQKAGPLDYGLEKLTLNFIAYRHNIENHTVQIFEPGHMETQQQYNNIAKKFSDVYLDWQFEKNMIYDLSADRYLTY